MKIIFLILAFFSAVGMFVSRYYTENDIGVVYHGFFMIAFILLHVVENLKTPED